MLFKVHAGTGIFLTAPLVAILLRSAEAACECGYQTNAGDIWQFSVTTQFSSITNEDFANSSDWSITSRVWDATNVSPVAINYTAANVNIMDQKLQLTCSAYDSDCDEAIASAQIQSVRSDILGGSFRATYSVSGVAGAVGALFFYASDIQEVDIEFLTRNDRVIHFSNQPSTTTYVRMPDDFVRTDAHTYRFDWTPSQTAFYVDNIMSNKFTTDIPSTNGSIYMNMWANGGSFAGAMPPTEDCVLSVSEISLYFNTSDTEADAEWQALCGTSKTRYCQIDPQQIQQNTTQRAAATKLPPRGLGIGRLALGAAALYQI